MESNTPCIRMATETGPYERTSKDCERKNLPRESDFRFQQDNDLPLVYELDILVLCLNHDPSPSIGSDGNLGSSSSKTAPKSTAVTPVSPNAGLLTSLNLHPSTFSLDSVYSLDCHHPGLSLGCKDLRPRLMAEFRRLFIGSFSWSFRRLASMIMFSISSVRRSITSSDIGGSC